MIPTATHDIAKTGSITPEQSIDMTFDEHSIAHIMSVLTDLYSDPELAIIREYSTNARDSHLESGQTRPIEVTTPSDLNPIFSVRDYGVGLSVDDIERIYSRYGASTKRGTDEQTGMLGLGCKSGLTYANQFTVVGVKGGIKTTVIVSRRDDGTGVMEVVDTCQTDEPNGVLVTIPAKRVNTLRNKADQFFRFWDSGTVLVNGKSNVSIKDTAHRIDDDLYMVTGQGDSDYVVMGNVAYNVGTKLYSDSYRYGWNSFSIVAFVPMGAVQFTPSREGLHMTRLTEKTLNSIKAAFLAKSAKAVQASIDASDTKAEALKAFLDWSKVLTGIRADDYTYNGSKVETSWPTKNIITFDPYARRYSTGYKSYIGVSDLNNCLVIDTSGYDIETINTNNRAKIRRYIEDNVVQVSRVVLADDMPWQGWVETYECDWDDIKAVRLNAPGQRAKTAGTYSLLNSSRFYDTVTSLDTTRPVVYFGPSDDVNEYNLIADVALVQFVKINANRWTKLERDYPGAMHVSKWAKQRLDSLVNALTEDNKAAYHSSYANNPLWRHMDTSLLDDQELADWLTVSRKPALKIDTNAMQRYAGLAGVNVVIPKPSVAEIDFHERYPLTKVFRHQYNVSSEIVAEMIFYINNKYQEAVK